MDQRSRFPQVFGAFLPVAVLAVLVVGYYGSLEPAGVASDIGDSRDHSVDVFRQPAGLIDLDRIELRPARPERYGLNVDADPLSAGARNASRRATLTRPDSAAHPAADEAMTAEPPSPAEVKAPQPPAEAKAPPKEDRGPVKTPRPPAEAKAPPKEDRGPVKTPRPPAEAKAPPKEDRGPVKTPRPPAEAKAPPKEDRGPVKAPQPPAEAKAPPKEDRGPVKAPQPPAEAKAPPKEDRASGGG